MCGIFGEFLFLENSADLSNFLARLDLLEHRGPDGYGFEYGDFQKKKYLLCHNLTTIEKKANSYRIF